MYKHSALVILVAIVAAALSAQTVDTARVTVWDTVFLPDSMDGNQQSADQEDRFYQLAQDAMNHKKSWLDTGLTIAAILVALVAIALPMMVIQIQRTRREIERDLHAMHSDIDSTCDAARKEMQLARTDIDAAVQRMQADVERSLKKIQDYVLKIKGLHQHATEAVADIDKRTQDLDKQIQKLFIAADEKADLEKAPAQRPKVGRDDIMATFDERVKLISDADAEEAVKEYEKLLNAMESNEIPRDRIPDSLLKNMGYSYSALRKWKEAAVEFEKYLEHHPLDADVLVGLGIAYGWTYDLTKDSKSLSLASAKLEDAARINPNQDSAFYNWGVALGEMFDKTGDFKWLEQAFEKYEKATSLNPEHDVAFCNWANDLAKMFSKTHEPKWREQALEKCQKALEIAPEKQDNQYYLAGLFSLLEEREDMLKALKEAVEFDKKFKKMAREDKDFEKYWDDPDFIALTKED